MNILYWLVYKRLSTSKLQRSDKQQKAFVVQLLFNEVCLYVLLSDWDLSFIIFQTENDKTIIWISDKKKDLLHLLSKWYNILLNV